MLLLLLHIDYWLEQMDPSVRWDDDAWISWMRGVIENVRTPFAARTSPLAATRPIA
ncbi:hypothetical protein [Pseudoxanthomonas japonensis]|uniref:hypothetical protein n=1 Tax=Pseudoxanthomonas japonensis TaxID=69284 RepID=UPI001BCD0633|nr:hypothetical protein [Pseudoxanthomonas japonensis]